MPALLAPGGPPDKENQVKIYQKYRFRYIPLWNSKDPDPDLYQHVGTLSVSKWKVRSGSTLAGLVLYARRLKSTLWLVWSSMPMLNLAKTTAMRRMTRQHFDRLGQLHFLVCHATVPAQRRPVWLWRAQPADSLLPVSFSFETSIKKWKLCIAEL
jgi:hypothetical protein